MKEKSKYQKSNQKEMLAIILIKLKHYLVME